MFEWLSSLPIWAQVAVGIVLGRIILILLFVVLTSEVGFLGCGCLAGGVLLLAAVGFVVVVVSNNQRIRWDNVIAGLIGFVILITTLMGVSIHCIIKIELLIPIKELSKRMEDLNNIDGSLDEYVKKIQR